MSADASRPKCYDCERRVPRAYLQLRPVVFDIEGDSGYEEVPVPLCSECEGRRFGFDCPQCGLTYDEKDNARYCCERAPGEAPDCPDCGRRMERVSWGYTAAGRPTCEVAECEECDVHWGKYTGWSGVDA